MKHRTGHSKVGRLRGKSSRMLTSLARSLLLHESVRTTVPRAKAVRPHVERLISLGRKNSLNTRRRLHAIFRDAFLEKKLMGELALRYKERPGGYTRIQKCGVRYGDAAPLAVIELLDRPEKAPLQ